MGAVVGEYVGVSLVDDQPIGCDVGDFFLGLLVGRILLGFLVGFR